MARPAQIEHDRPITRPQAHDEDLPVIATPTIEGRLGVAFKLAASIARFAAPVGLTAGMWTNGSCDGGFARAKEVATAVLAMFARPVSESTTQCPKE